MSPLACLLSCLMLACLLATTQGQSQVQGFSEAEQACFREKKILYPSDNRCYALLSKGPCEAGSWLVLDKAEAENGSGDPIPICQPCACCKALHVYWPVDGQCHKITTEGAKLCKEAGRELKSDLFGEGHCPCVSNPPHISMANKPDGPCFEVHQRGPCSTDSVVQPEDFGNKKHLGTCRHNKCSNATKNHNNSMYAYNDADRKCYRLGEQGKCGATATFQISTTTLKPICHTPVADILPIPDRCTLDPTTGLCVVETIVISETYVRDIMKDTCKVQSRRKKTSNKCSKKP